MRSSHPLNLVIYATALSLAGCEKREGPAAEEEYRMVDRQKESTLEDMCISAKKVADGYLHDGNEGEYKRTKAIADKHCLTRDEAARGAEEARTREDPKLERLRESLKDLEDAVE